jgi:uncharacterized membrane protein HdeD (DUF308 family)
MVDDVAVAEVTTVSAVPWWTVLLEGIIALIFGILFFAWPGQTALFTALFIAWFWLITGVFQLISLFWDRTDWGWRLFGGIIGVIAGWFIIANAIPGAVALFFIYAIILGVQGLVIGIVYLVQAFRGAGWGRGLLGALAVILGIVLLLNPIATTLALPWVFGALLTVGGIFTIVTSFMLKKATGQ